MLEHVCIMTFGGAVLWAWTGAGATIGAAAVSPIDQLISHVLIEDRSDARREHIVNDWKLKWLMSVETQLVFIVCVQRFLQLRHVNAFLEQLRDAFRAHVAALCPRALSLAKSDPRACSGMYAAVDFAKAFDAEFRTLLAEFDVVEQEAAGGRGGGAAQIDQYDDVYDYRQDVDEDDSAPPPNANASTLPPDAAEQMQNAGGGGGGARGPGGKKGNNNNNNNNNNSSPQSPNARAPKMVMTKGGKKLVLSRAGGGAASSQPDPKPGGKQGGKAARQAKEARSWDSRGNALTSTEVAAREQAAADLEAASSRAGAEQIEEAAVAARAKYLKIDARTGQVAQTRTDDWNDQVPAEERGRFSSWFRSIVGNCELDQQDLNQVLPQLREKLISKNVAVDVAERICESLRTSLAGRQVGSFESLEHVVEVGLVEALRRILRPRTEINVLREAEAAKQRGKPYVITFVGVNGVGKSTSLSKVAYFLQQNGFSMLIAAGDTFRHGAVEQLQVHGRCLDVPIFQLGYGTDPSIVTRQAVQFAAKNHIDVVLVDTAGRMQDHESRMQALARLINDNNPDRVLFVGEALVGNNGIDQLRKFNQCLQDYAAVGADARGIDGIILTKFDTIDDKVGAALSMVYQLGQPIVFVGVGQTYQDLKSIEPDVVVECLMR